MKVTNLLLKIVFLLAMSLATILASPVLQPRGGGSPGGVYLCSGPNWAPPCIWVKPHLDDCVSLYHPWNVRGSFGPDKGAYCVIYE